MRAGMRHGVIDGEAAGREQMNLLGVWKDFLLFSCLISVWSESLDF